MKRLTTGALALTLLACGYAASCGKANAQADKKGGDDDTGPKPIQIQPDQDANNFKVDHPERFPVVPAAERIASPELNVTGVVSPDVSRQVAVPSLASGKIVEINARLGDEVRQGQLLFKVQSSDVAGAFSDYRQAVKNEILTRQQLDRARTLYDAGAYPRSAVEIAQNAEDDALVVIDTTLERLHLLGLDPKSPTGTVEVKAPVSGTITDQQITIASGVQAMTAPNPFTISDVSHVWIVCDVFENDMAQVRQGEPVDVTLAAYPDKPMKARVSNILPVLDPNIRTAKVRLELDNPGLLRLGMFVTATFHSMQTEKRTAVPSTAILHLQDREWVYMPRGGGNFRRAEVKAGVMLPNNMQEVISGLSTGDQVVSNALVFQNTVQQ